MASRYFDFSSALTMIKNGHKMARYGFTKHNFKYVRMNYGSVGVMSHLELYYPPGERYPNGMAVPWAPSRCDLMENDWYEISSDQ